MNIFPGQPAYARKIAHVLRMAHYSANADGDRLFSDAPQEVIAAVCTGLDAHESGTEIVAYRLLPMKAVRA